jgi:glycosyltransferase involved in cell wall biosynthesis
MANSPWLSVVVPWWNRQAYALETLESMARQTERGFECIVVDQGRDATLRVAEAYRDRFDLRVVYAPEHADWPSKTNVGFREARGQYVCMLHTDDVWRPDRVARLREARERHPQASLLFHAVRFIDPASRELGLWRAPLAPDRLLPGTDVLEHLIIQNFISCPAPVLRRQIVGAGIDPSLWYTGDWDLYLRATLAGSAVYIDEPLADFRLHRTSLTMQNSRSTQDRRQQLDRVLERYGRELPDARREELLRVARFSNAVNVALADGFHGKWSSLLRLIPRASSLGIADWRRYLSDSRIAERTSARLKLAWLPLRGKSGMPPAERVRAPGGGVPPV